MESCSAGRVASDRAIAADQLMLGIGEQQQRQIEQLPHQAK